MIGQEHTNTCSIAIGQTGRFSIGEKSCSVDDSTAWELGFVVQDERGELNIVILDRKTEGVLVTRAGMLTRVKRHPREKLRLVFPLSRHWSAYEEAKKSYQDLATRDRRMSPDCLQVGAVLEAAMDFDDDPAEAPQLRPVQDLIARFFAILRGGNFVEYSTAACE